MSDPKNDNPPPHTLQFLWMPGWIKLGLRKICAFPRWCGTCFPFRSWHVCKNLFQYQNIGAVIGHPIWNLHSLFISNHYMFTRFWLVFFSSSFTATTWFKKCWKREGILDVKFHCVVTRHSEFVVSDVQRLLHIRWMQSVSHYRWSHLEWTFSQPILFSHNRQTKYHTTSIGTCSPFCLQSWHQWYPKKTVVHGLWSRPNDLPKSKSDRTLQTHTFIYNYIYICMYVYRYMQFWYMLASVIKNKENHSLRFQINCSNIMINHVILGHPTSGKNVLFVGNFPCMAKLASIDTKKLGLHTQRPRAQRCAPRATRCVSPAFHVEWAGENKTKLQVQKRVRGGLYNRKQG
jgi:hypothetical protein